jgi:signal peptidase II
LSGRKPYSVFNGLLTLRLERNSGAAFSFGTGYTMIFSVVAVVVAVVVVRTARGLRSPLWGLALGLLLGGATGNLADRVFRSPGVLRGQVVDFLEIPNWPVFNIADSSIVVASVLMVFLSVRGVPLAGHPVPRSSLSNGPAPEGFRAVSPGPSD